MDHLVYLRVPGKALDLKTEVLFHREPGIWLIPASLPELEEHPTMLFETFLTGTGATRALCCFPVGYGL